MLGVGLGTGAVGLEVWITSEELWVMDLEVYITSEELWVMVRD